MSPYASVPKSVKWTVHSGLSRAPPSQTVQHDIGPTLPHKRSDSCRCCRCVHATRHMLSSLRCALVCGCTMAPMHVTVHNGTGGVTTNSEGLQRFRRPHQLCSKAQFIYVSTETSSRNSCRAIVENHFNRLTSFSGSVLRDPLRGKCQLAGLFATFGSHSVILAKLDTVRLLASVHCKQGESQHAVGLCHVLQSTSSPGSK